ncbi:MAG: PTS sugar transporter subunit IIA [Pontixanthobacter sp.]
MNPDFKLLPEAVSIIGADSKDAILAALADRFAAAYDVDPVAVLESLEEREKLGSTGFGRGIAIPHARLDGIKRPLAVFFRLEAPVDFGAADGLPVELVFGLLSPTNAGATHLHSLAAISRLARDEFMHESLLAAKDSAALYALLANTTASAGA